MGRAPQPPLQQADQTEWDALMEDAEDAQNGAASSDLTNLLTALRAGAERAPATPPQRSELIASTVTPPQAQWAFHMPTPEPRPSPTSYRRPVQRSLPRIKRREQSRWPLRPMQQQEVSLVDDDDDEDLDRLEESRRLSRLAWVGVAHASVLSWRMHAGTAALWHRPSRGA